MHIYNVKCMETRLGKFDTKLLIGLVWIEVRGTDGFYSRILIEYFTVEITSEND